MLTDLMCIGHYGQGLESCLSRSKTEVLSRTLRWWLRPESHINKKKVGLSTYSLHCICCQNRFSSGTSLQIICKVQLGGQTTITTEPLTMDLSKKQGRYEIETSVVREKMSLMKCKAPTIQTSPLFIHLLFTQGNSSQNRQWMKPMWHITFHNLLRPFTAIEKFDSCTKIKYSNVVFLFYKVFQIRYT